jgi:glycosyltransferase involved in cell wall biosynthesis
VKISATIITYNEERNIARAIESLRCCDEIVVVDSGSSDRTVELAANLGARVVESPWPGYAKQKNVAAERAANDWILSLDADEALSEGLEAEIWQIKKNGPKYDAYVMPRLAKYLGTWIFHSGWYPDKKVRLYHRDKARWTGEYVHESVEVDGTIGELEGRILHHTCDSLSEHLRTLDARPLYNSGGGADRGHAQAGDAVASGDRSGVDVRQHVHFQARISGRVRGVGDRVHGGVLQFLEVCEGEVDGLQGG